MFLSKRLIYKKIRSAFKVAILPFLLISFYSCGSSDNEKESPPADPPVKIIIGTVASGSPLIGKITIKDSSIPEQIKKNVDTKNNGTYSIDVTNMKPPFLLMAMGKTGESNSILYSAATAEDIDGTVNITPLTNLIVANMAKKLPEDFFDYYNPSNPPPEFTKKGLNDAQKNIKTQIKPVIEAFGLDFESIDFLRDEFKANHTGIDALLDILKITTGKDETEPVVITNKMTKESIEDYITSLDDTQELAAGNIEQFKGTINFINQINSLFKTGVPQEDVLAQYMPDFTHNGISLEYIKNLSIGSSFDNLVIIGAGDTSDEMIVSFDIINMETGKIVKIQSAIVFFNEDNETFTLRGNNQRIKITEQISYLSLPDRLLTEITLSVEDPADYADEIHIRDNFGLPVGQPVVGKKGNEGFSDIVIIYDSDKKILKGSTYQVDLKKKDVLLHTFSKVLNRDILPASQLTEYFPIIPENMAYQIDYFLLGEKEDVDIYWTTPSGMIFSNLELVFFKDDNASEPFKVEIDREKYSENFINVKPVEEGYTRIFLSLEYENLIGNKFIIHKIYEKSVISGNVTNGAPVSGIVKIKDSNPDSPNQKSLIIKDDGTFSFSAMNMTLPLYFKVEGRSGSQSITMYSIATDDDINGTVNISPLSEIILANAAGIDAETVFNSTDHSTHVEITNDRVVLAENNLRGRLERVLDAYAIDDENQEKFLLNFPYEVEDPETQTKMNKFFNSFYSFYVQSTNHYRINNLIGNDFITDDFTKLDDTGNLNWPEPIDDYFQKYISKVYSQFSELTDLYKVKNPDLGQAHISQNFLHSGEEINFWTDLPENTTFTNLVFEGFHENKIMIISFDINRPGSAPEKITDFIIEVNQVAEAPEWTLVGDQKCTKVYIDMIHVEHGLSGVESRLEITAENKDNKIERLFITGLGPKRFLNKYSDNHFRIQAISSFSEKELLEKVTENTEIGFEAHYYDGGIKTFIEKPKYRLHTNTYLFENRLALFPNTINAEFDDYFNGISTDIHVEWTNPTQLMILKSIFIGVSDGPGGGWDKTIKGDEINSNNIVVTPVGNFGHGFLTMSYRDGYGRLFNIVKSYSK